MSILASFAFVSRFVPRKYAFKATMIVENIIGVVGRFVRRKATCGDCGHFFDPADERCFRSNDPFYRDPRYRGGGSICPACNQMSGASTAWAVHNDCQGVFTCMVHGRKDEAIAEADSLGFDVVPVRILVEPEDDWWKRDYDERDLTSDR